MLPPSDAPPANSQAQPAIPGMDIAGTDVPGTPAPRTPEPENPATAVIPNQGDVAVSTRRIFRLSPLIRFTLLSFYVALTLPLPFLADFTDAPVSPILLSLGLGLGAVALYAALSERVIVDSQGIQVTYPNWLRPLWRKGWTLSWTEIQALKPRTTGQGGLVYYFLSQSGQAYLLPMRVAGFAELVRRVQAQTGIDTRDVRPLAQPWMYLFLLLLTLLLLAMDVWTIGVALGQG